MLNPTTVAQCLAEAVDMRPGWPVMHPDLPVIVSDPPAIMLISLKERFF
jgi:hypothetical protein